VTRGPDPQTLREVIERASDPKAWERWEGAIRQARYCRRPIRLRGVIKGNGGRTLYSTAAEPDGVLLKACGTRRESVCKPCSRVYKGDTWKLVEAGLRGGKGVPETVAKHPMVFATFTAPSFGLVHQASGGRRGSGICLPRRDAEECRHGVSLVCWHKHSDNDEPVGQPICPGCFDYDAAIVWNALAPELWRRTTIYVRRQLAAQIGISQKSLGLYARLSFFKVAEYQRRGALHFHAILRVDGPKGDSKATQPEGVTVEHLRAAIEEGASRAHAPPPSGLFAEVGWGEQLDISPIDGDGASAAQAAAYIAKYATKHTEDVGGLVRPTTVAQAQELGISEHLQRYLARAEDLSRRPELSDLKLERSAHLLGFRGHWATKSRGYSTTLTALREARRSHAAGEGAAQQKQATWQYLGMGHQTRGDKVLSDSAAHERDRVERIARVEVRGRGRAR
jgi:hypothetical protein